MSMSSIDSTSSVPQHSVSCLRRSKTQSDKKSAFRPTIAFDIAGHSHQGTRWLCWKNGDLRPMYNLSSMTRNVDAIRRLFKVDPEQDRTGNAGAILLRIDLEQPPDRVDVTGHRGEIVHRA